jgi:hypothetical protein
MFLEVAAEPDVEMATCDVPLTTNRHRSIAYHIHSYVSANLTLHLQEEYLNHKIRIYNKIIHSCMSYYQRMILHVKNKSNYHY